MAPAGVITYHDTNGYQLSCMHTPDDIRGDGHEVIDFPEIGAGFALIRLKR